MREDRTDDLPEETPAGEPEGENRAAHEERAAAAEAAAIGGDPGAELTEDPAEQPVTEGGGGEAEGFEVAEDQLREHAEHGEDFRRPGQEEFPGEEESDRSTAAYGDADRREPPEPDIAGRDDV